jgi:hypothetical protein
MGSFENINGRADCLSGIEFHLYAVSARFESRRGHRLSLFALNHSRQKPG